MNKQSNVCCICGKEFSEYGNNPYPVKDEGVCCDKCNYDAVIPARMDMMFPARKNRVRKHAI